MYQRTIQNKYPKIVPKNWMKFGLKVDEVQAKIHNIWVKLRIRIEMSYSCRRSIQNEWAVSYHGTLPNAALSMVKHRQICLPGDTLSDGSRLSIRRGHIPKQFVQDFTFLSFCLFRSQNAFFTSPTIRYASQNHYASPIEFTSIEDKRRYLGKIVLRCRQMPNSFSVQCQTLSNVNNDFCDWIGNDEIEWKTDQRGTVVFDGLCIQIQPITNSFQQTNSLI